MQYLCRNKIYYPKQIYYATSDKTGRIGTALRLGIHHRRSHRSDASLYVDL